jgi:hypothetical protein
MTPLVVAIISLLIKMAVAPVYVLINTTSLDLSAKIGVSLIGSLAMLIWGGRSVFNARLVAFFILVGSAVALVSGGYF